MRSACRVPLNILAPLAVLALLAACQAVLAADGEWEKQAAEGVTALHQGRYADAQPLFENCLKLAEAFGEKDPRLSIALNNLGNLMENQARYAEAEPLLKRALALREKLFGPDKAEVAESANNLGMLYDRMNRFADAEVLLKRAVAIADKVSGLDSDDAGASRMNLATHYKGLSKWPEAETAFTEALAICEKVHGPGDASVAAVLNNMGAMYMAMGRFEPAEKCLSRSLSIAEKALGPEHPHTAGVLGGLASALMDQGKFAEAEPLLKRSIAIIEKRLPPGHPYLADPTITLARLCDRQGRPAEAEALTRKALNIYENAYGTQHEQVASACLFLAFFLRSQKKYGDAGAFYDRAQDIYTHLFGANCQQLAIVSVARAFLFVEQDKFTEAMVALRDGIRGAEMFRNNIFAVTSEREKQAWVLTNQFMWHTQLALTFPEKDNPHAPDYAWEACLSYKGAVADACAGEMEAAYTSGDPALKSLAADLGAVRRELAAATLSGRGALTPEEFQKKTQALDERREKIESELALKSAPFARLRRERSADAQKIVDLLPENAALISFVNMHEYDDNQRDVNNNRMIALVMQRGKQPRLFSLGIERPMAAAAQAFVEECQNAGRRIAELGDEKATEELRKKSRALSDLTLKPIWDAIKDKSLWLISPDSVLSTVQFAILPEPGADQLAVEKREIAYLDSGREIINFGQALHGNIGGRQGRAADCGAGFRPGRARFHA